MATKRNKMQVGDLVKTTCFGAKGEVGEVGIIVADHKFNRCFQVLLGKKVFVMNQDGLEVISESR
jgi:hypothetical protein